MVPIEDMNWIKGLRAAYARLDAEQRELYSWVARTRTGSGYVFSAEIDHRVPESTVYEREAGTFFKSVPAMSRSGGDAPASIRHSRELLEAASESCRGKVKCRILLVEGSKFGRKKGGIRAAADEGHWFVTSVSGSVEGGYRFNAVRTDEIALVARKA